MMSTHRTVPTNGRCGSCPTPEAIGEASREDTARLPTRYVGGLSDLQRSPGRPICAPLHGPRARQDLRHARHTPLLSPVSAGAECGWLSGPERAARASRNRACNRQPESPTAATESRGHWITWPDSRLHDPAAPPSRRHAQRAAPRDRPSRNPRLQATQPMLSSSGIRSESGVPTVLIGQAPVVRTCCNTARCR